MALLSNIHVARHVDIDGISQESGQLPESDPYAQTVTRARQLVRTLEAAAQSLYDDATTLFLTIQGNRRDESGASPVRSPAHNQIEALAAAMQVNMRLVHQTLETLWAVGNDQADLSQGDYNGSIEWRLSRLSMIHTQFGGTLRPNSHYPYESENEDVVDLSHAFRLGGSKTQDGGEAVRSVAAPHQSSSQLSSDTSIDTSLVTAVDDTAWTTSDSLRSTALDSTGSPPSDELTGESDPILDDCQCFALSSCLIAEGISAVLPRPGNRRGNKPWLILGEEAPQHYQDTVNADLKPWYLRPNYSTTDILIDYPEGIVRGGTVSALVERLTAHEHGGKGFRNLYSFTGLTFQRPQIRRSSRRS